MIFQFYKWYIFRLTEPNPPSNVTVTSAETHSMKAVWFEENDAVSSYVVRYKDLSNDSALMVESSVNDTSLSLPQLQPGHTYSIRIAAVYFGVESNQTTPITDNTGGYWGHGWIVFVTVVL